MLFAVHTNDDLPDLLHLFYGLHLFLFSLSNFNSFSLISPLSITPYYNFLYCL